MKSNSEIRKGQLVIYQRELAKIIELRQNTVIIEQFGKRLVTTVQQLKEYELDLTDDKQFREALLYKMENIEKSNKRTNLLLTIPYVIISVLLLICIVWIGGVWLTT